MAFEFPTSLIQKTKWRFVACKCSAETEFGCRTTIKTITFVIGEGLIFKDPWSSQICKALARKN